MKFPLMEDLDDGLGAFEVGVISEQEDGKAGGVLGFHAMMRNGVMFWGDSAASRSGTKPGGINKDCLSGRNWGAALRLPDR